MGNEPPRKNHNPIQDKMQFEIACAKVKGYLEINKDRKLNNVILSSNL